MKRRNHRRNQFHHSSASCPFKEGDRIQAVDKFDCHDYLRGEIYTVIDIDPNDCTLRASGPRGEMSSWIRWNDCRAAYQIGWDWLKGQLPSETLELLLAFDGLSRLRLRHDVSLALVEGIPSLKERIIGCTAKLESSMEAPH